MQPSKKDLRIGEENYNHQNCLMKIIEYNKSIDIVVEFQDKYMAKVHTQYSSFKRGNVKNPYYPMVYNVGRIGNKYLSNMNGKQLKEYVAWQSMLKRCFDDEYKKKKPTYKNVTCCEEWLLYENFYNWLHNQENFDKWLNGSKWEIDKDILVKRNKVYSPDTCCLVPNNVNGLFIGRSNVNKELPIGVVRSQNGLFRAKCSNQITGNEYTSYHSTVEEAFQAYKTHKESLIKQVAELEYSKGNITKACYDAMMSYEVEIND